MDLYYSPLVDLLVNNIGISCIGLYKISGISNKRDFLTGMNSLLAERKISKEYRPEFIRGRYSPKVMYLSACIEGSDMEVKEYKINFIPTSVLEKELEYVSNGIEQEDCLEFEIQITGYEIREMYKSYFENQTGLVLDFDKYRYYLWAKFLDPFAD